MPHELTHRALRAAPTTATPRAISANEEGSGIHTKLNEVRPTRFAGVPGGVAVGFPVVTGNGVIDSVSGLNPEAPQTLACPASA